MKKLIPLAMDFMGVAVSIIDTKGTLLYYNEQAAKILDRRPEYIGTDIRSHHGKEDSNRRVDHMLEAFRGGQREAFHYEASPYGESILVILSPIFEKGTFVGCVQSVQLKRERPTESDYSPVP